MKRISYLFLVLIFFVCHSTYSQNNTVNRDFYQAKVAKYSKLRNTGIALTAGGIILTGVGIGVMMPAFDMPKDNNGLMTSEATLQLYGGLLLAELGLIATGGGITLWVIGGSKAKKYKDKASAISLMINPSCQQIVAVNICF
jgi:hypothetical protein